MSAGLLGNAELEPYVKIRHRGTDYYFPLAHDPDDRYLGGGDIQTSTLESFSASAVAGDPSLVSNELLAVLLWSNWQGGMGTVKYQEQEGTGSLDSFSYATLDTRFQGMALLPPRWVSLGTAVGVINGMLFLGYDAPYQIVAWGVYLGLARVIHGAINNTTLAASWSTTGGMTNNPTVVRAIVPFNGLLVAITDRAIYTNVPSTTVWTEEWVSTGGFWGLAVHDNKLYTIRDSDKKLYWTLDPTTTTAWPNASSDPLHLDPQEVIVKIAEWKNRQDTRSLFVLTDKRIMAWDDDGYWATFLPSGSVPSGAGDISVWPQDKALYYAPADNGANVMQLQNQTISNVSPNKKGGVPGATSRVIRQLAGGLNFLFARASQANPPRVVGLANTQPVAATSYGTIMAYNGQGWHTLAEQTSAAQTIDHFAWAKDQVVFAQRDGAFYTLYTPDAPQSPPYINGPVQYQEGTFYIESADADAGLENIYKTARYWELVFQDGMPVNHSATLTCSFDGGATWTTQGTVTGLGPVSDPTALWRFPVTITGITDARGVPFLRVRWRLTMTKNSGASATVTPILRSVALYYLRANDLIDGIQFAIDLSPDRVRRLVSGLGLGNTYTGKTPQKLRQILQEIKRSKYNPALTYGPPNNQVTIPAAEIRVAQRENPRTALGQYILTARDVSTQTTTVS